MLRNIPTNLSPQLVAALMEMGHGDTIVLGDANFPGHTVGRRVIRADGLMIADLLDSILSVMPLDRYVKCPIGLMQTANDDPRPSIWDAYSSLIQQHEADIGIEYIERSEFYERAREAFAVVVTGETAVYGNVIVHKGVITQVTERSVSYA
jgi:L-fucose mutarotase